MSSLRRRRVPKPPRSGSDYELGRVGIEEVIPESTELHLRCLDCGEEWQVL